MLLVFHEKADCVSAFTTTKAFIDFFRSRYGEGGAFFIMKRAKADIVGTSFFQFYKAANHFDNVDTGKNLLYGLLWNQGSKFTRKVSVF